ncbi:MAG: hypothetical protein H6741_05430 [Alphaproteobacteria bacterium]|nr:hypothetical protein [Alphaproteobacteria bacterium]MCB9792148.1 hypothetical protein [Alphaproteobacteria bacterium]
MRLALLVALAGLGWTLSACCNGGGGCLGSVGLTVLTPEGAPATVLTARIVADDQVFEVDCDGGIDSGAGPADEIYCEAPGRVRVWTTEDLLSIEIVAEEGGFIGELEPAYTDIAIGPERCGVYCTSGEASVSVEAG